MKNIFILAFISSVLLPMSMVGQCYEDRHNTSKSAGWTSCTVSTPPVESDGDIHWIHYDFGHVYSLHQLHYWNHNHPEELTNGLQDVRIYLSEDGVDYIKWGDTTFNEADGSAFYEGEDGPNFGGINGRYLMIQGVSNYGGACYSLGEIRIGLQEVVVPEVVIDAKAFLSGPYNTSTGMMTDLLRTKNLIPLIEPYTGKASFVHVGEGGGESVISAAVFDNPVDNDDIVDWVFIELRDKNDINAVLNTKSALIQRDGDIVDVDGTSSVTMLMDADDYYLAIRHRNHLGIITAAPVTLASSSISTIDFTSDISVALGSTQYTYSDGSLAMYAGNANGANVQSAAQKQVRMTGPSSINDYSNLLNQLSGIYTNLVTNVYEDGDINLDGNIRMTGPSAINDYSKLLLQLDGIYTNFITQPF